MSKDFNATEQTPLRNTVLSLAIAAALCTAAAPSHAGVTSVRGVVAGTLFTSPVNSDNPALSRASRTVASVYAGAKVCFDLNNNGICDPNEPNTTSKSDGTFALASPIPSNIVAEISTSASNGQMQLYVDFGVETDPNIDQVLSQLRVSQAQAQLPPLSQTFRM